MGMWGVVYLLCGCMGTLLHTATPSTSNVLSTLADLDFHRIVSDHTHHTSDSTTVPRLSLKRELIGAGYHREVSVEIKMEGLGNSFGGRIVLVENITRDLYIDLDQVRGIIIMKGGCL